jgi:hypothetical protein
MKTRNLFALWVLLGGLCGLSGAGAAGNLLPSGDFEDEEAAKKWGDAHLVAPSGEENHTGGWCLRFVGQTWGTAPDPVEIDPEQSYELRAFIKEPGVRVHSELIPMETYIGLRLLDKNQEQISPWAVLSVPHTETTLAKEAAVGDTVLRLAGTPWESVPQPAIAFDIKDDFSDIPNATAVPLTEIRPSEGGFEVQLATPLATAYPAGTKVRQHRWADFPVLIAEPGAEWQEKVMEIGGVSMPGTAEMSKFWPGTRYVRVSIAPIAKQGAGYGTPVELLLDDVSFIQTSSSP